MMSHRFLEDEGGASYEKGLNVKYDYAQDLEYSGCFL